MRIQTCCAAALCLFSTAFASTPAPRALEPVTPAHSAGAVRALIEEGNQRYAQGDYAGALERYRGARAGGDSDALGGVGGVEAAYNEAVTLHALGEVESAKDLLSRVEASPDAGRLAAMSRYNQGVIEYQEALGDGQILFEKADEALAQLQQAEIDFRTAVNLDATDDSSKKNLEITRRYIKGVQDLKNLSEQIGTQAKELADHLDSAAKEQSSESLENQSSQRGDSVQQQRQDQQVLNTRSDEIGQRFKNLENVIDALESSGAVQQTPDFSGPFEEAKKAFDTAKEAQRSAQNSLDQRRTEDAAQPQMLATEAMENAAEQIRKLIGEQQDQGSQSDDPDTQQKEQEQNQEGGEQEQQQSEQQEGGEQEQGKQQQQQQEGEGEGQEQEAQQAQIGEEDEDGEEQDLAERLIEREAEKREEMRQAKGKREPVEKDW